MPPRPIEREYLGQSAMLGLLERASANAPEDLAAVRRYANACVHVGDTARAVPALQCLTAAAPDDAEAWAALRRMLSLANRPREAVEAAEQAVQHRPDSSDYLGEYGFALRAVDEDDLADRVFGRAFEIDPRNPYVRRGYGQSLIRASDGPALARHCEEGMAAVGPGAWLIAQYLIALSLLGRRAAVAQLLDYDRLVTERDVACPAGFASLDAFNAALRDEIFALEAKASGQEPKDVIYRGQRIKGGLQGAIDKLGAEHAPASAALLGEFTRQADDYLAGLEDCLQRRAAPKATTVTTEVIVTGPGSSVSRHTHACSWLSGVYYVAVPTGTGERGTGGCMEFGPPVHKIALPEGIWPTRLLRPRPGLMALFPGYVYHHVHANDVADDRIAITYDGVPPKEVRVRGVSHEEWLSGLFQE